VDRRFVESVLLAAVAIAAIAAAAATLPSATETGAGGGGGGPPASGSGGGGGLIPTPEPRSAPIFHLPDLGAFATAVFVLVLVAALLYAFLYRRELFDSLARLALLFAVLLVVFWLASLVDIPPADVPSGGGWLAGEPAGGSGGTTPVAQPLVLLLVVGVVAAGVVAILVRTGTIRPPGVAPAPPEPTEEAMAVGEAAGRAADRIEEADDVDNEIYRAWREMTDLLDVPNPGSSTPGEFAVAAVEAGMVRADVDELTMLFEDVRYGGDEPTEASEGRALSILRRIEATYAPEEAAEANAGGEVP